MFLRKWMLISLAFPLSAMAGNWSEHRANVAGYNSRIDSLEKEIEHLTHEKSRVDNPERLTAILESMVNHHEQLKAAAQKRNEEIKHMRYRHPERGKEFDTKYYKVYEVKSLKDFEEELGLGGALNRVKEKIEKHYGVQPEEKEESVQRARKKKGESKESQRIKLVK